MYIIIGYLHCGGFCALLYKLDNKIMKFTQIISTYTVAHALDIELLNIIFICSVYVCAHAYLYQQME